MTDLIWLPTKEYTLLQDRNSYLFLDVGLFFNGNSMGTSNVFKSQVAVQVAGFNQISCYSDSILTSLNAIGTRALPGYPYHGREPA